MEAPLYGLSINLTSPDQSKTTKTINGLNLPPITNDNRGAIGTDLGRFGRVLYEISNRSAGTMTLIDKRGVYGNV